jgi:predicted SPOUT superfamily RNA methylase MTH1
MNNRLVLILLLALSFGAGIGVCQWWHDKQTPQVEEQSKVLLEKVKTVAKLITVEGYFSEVYNYKDYWGYDFSPFQKKALVLVKARVSVGYDLAKMNMKADSKTKTLTVSQPPQAQVLSIDHDLSYYDISEGTFNSFSAEDYSKIQVKVKDFIKEKAEQSDLKQRAQTQGNQMLDVIRFMVESAGWKMVVENEAAVNKL